MRNEPLLWFIFLSSMFFCAFFKRSIQRSCSRSLRYAIRSWMPLTLDGRRRNIGRRKGYQSMTCIRPAATAYPSIHCRRNVSSPVVTMLLSMLEAYFKQCLHMWQVNGCRSPTIHNCRCQARGQTFHMVFEVIWSTYKIGKQLFGLEILASVRSILWKLYFVSKERTW